MRILLLTTHFLPELTGNAPLLGELCEDLVARGHQVRVLAGPAEHNVAELDQRYLRFGLCREQLAGVPVVRVNGLPFRGSRWAHRLFVLVWFPVIAFAVGLVMGKADVILCPSPPMWLGVTARLLGTVRRAPYVYVVQDLWPDAPILLGLVRSKPVICLLRWLEQRVYRGARRVVTITEAMAQRLLQLRVPPEKLDLVQNWIDVGFFAAERSAEGPLRVATGAGAGDVVVLYSGNMGRSHPVDLVVGAARLLRHRKGMRFALIGAGAGLAPAQEMARNAQLESVRFLPFQPRASLPLLLADADIAVVTLRGGMGAFSLPSRMYMFMAAALPIVGAFDADSGAAALLQASGCGLLVPPDDAAALAAGLARLADEPALREQLGRAGRDYVERHCRREMATARYEETLRRVVEPAEAVTQEAELPAGAEIRRPDR
jgi:colanic acid biosynthesis glycosyl transferase WcaI